VGRLNRERRGDIRYAKQWMDFQSSVGFRDAGLVTRWMLLVTPIPCLLVYPQALDRDSIVIVITAHFVHQSRG